MTQTPPGAALVTVTETVSCGWVDSKPLRLGMLEGKVTGAGAADEVARFYADLARSSGWQGFDQDVNVYNASKPDGTDCTWNLYVLSSVAEGTYQVQITYTPRDLRPTCL
ncbi:hypothetical protein AB0C02_17975 [Micromonospora sp. NPDC048999]|uniref:hypothetical protein n=1 Tax=Micromonospora sp. NPDC048999 TaxID=3155391 RepID=UPI0033FF47DA